MTPKKTVDPIMQFSALAVEAADPGGVLVALGTAVAQAVGADAVAVLSLGEGPARVIGSVGLGNGLSDWRGEEGAGRAQSAARFLAACRKRFGVAHSIRIGPAHEPIAQVVALRRARKGLAPRALKVAESLVQMAGVALERAAGRAELRRLIHDLRNALQPLGIHRTLLDGRSRLGEEELGRLLRTLARSLASGSSVVEGLERLSRSGSVRATPDTPEAR